MDIPRWAVDVAQILSAIGTCGAVIVSLYLARRNESPRLRLHIHRHFDLTIGGDNPGERRFIAIEIANIGTMPVTVRSVTHSVWRDTGHQYMQFGLGRYHGGDLPRTLTHGESFTLMNELTKADPWSSIRTLSAVKKMRFDVAISTGKIFRRKPSLDFANRFWTEDLAALQQRRPPCPHSHSVSDSTTV